jgi:hypothetical protein
VVCPNGLHTLFADIHEGTVMNDPAVAKQLRQQRESVVGQHLIDERCLTFEGVDRAAAWESVVIKGWFNDFRKEFSGCAEPSGGAAIPTVQWLAENELAGVGGVTKIEPIGDAASRTGNFRVDELTRRSRVDAAEQNVEIGYVRIGRQVLCDRRPVETPKEIQTAHHYDDLG